jgi:hypothetical protein
MYLLHFALRCQAITAKSYFFVNPDILANEQVMLVLVIQQKAGNLLNYSFDWINTSSPSQLNLTLSPSLVEISSI